MPNEVTVEKYRDAADAPEKLSSKMNEIVEEIRHRAFELFEHEGCRHGADREHWSRAERDVVWSPTADLVENEKSFAVQLAIPGFDPREIHLSATPQFLIIEADSAHGHDQKQSAVQFCEFSEKRLFRRVDLPSEIDLEKITASLEKGILRINAPKAEQKRVTATAAS